MSAAPQAPGRTRALLVLGVVAVMLLVLCAGVVVVIRTTMNGDGDAPRASTSAPASTPDGSAPPAGESESQARRDEIAAEPMMQLPESAAQPQPLVADTAGPPIVVPAPTGAVVPGGPPAASGFPKTPEGALGQLAAIDEAAMSTTDMARVREVYAWAAMPGAVPEVEWSPAVGVRALISSLGGTEDARTARASYAVVQGQIKGTDGPDFAVVCVLGELTVSAATSARAGVADCQRMVWHDGRWRIGPGGQPAYPPHAWPGSADAVRGGWKELIRA
ncbi:hypothetical protein [Salinispora mooreana]|uniref:hypothetical protein n=1 Tax=Salinispora mooreana TaxID=999545 RepID=UPI0003779479|nr:hypothetical protein [Salinispora mooreana]